MRKSSNHVRFLALAQRSGLSDADLAKVLKVNQSTVWRLKNDRIAKNEKHIALLERHIQQSPSTEDDELDDLIAMAKLSPRLRTALLALRRLMHEDA
jgi:transcriptional regulator with XRE-family HTH domain